MSGVAHEYQFRIAVRFERGIRYRERIEGIRHGRALGHLDVDFLAFGRRPGDAVAFDCHVHTATSRREYEGVFDGRYKTEACKKWRMEIEVNLFGPFREAVGQKTVYRELPAEATVADLFRDLAAEYPDLSGQVLTDAETVADSVTVTKNGKSVALFDGSATELADGDVIRAAPPVHGG